MEMLYLPYLFLLILPALAGRTTSQSPRPRPSTNPSIPGPTRVPDPGCPYPSDVATYLPYPGNCRKFYECYQGSRRAFTCPANEYWNQAKSYCDYKDNVQCEDDPESTVTEGPTTSAVDYVCATKPDGSLNRYPGNCALYIECNEGQSIILHCPGKLLFDAVLKICNYPDTVDCNINT